MQGLRLQPKLKRRLTYPAGGICQGPAVDRAFLCVLNILADISYGSLRCT